MAKKITAKKNTTAKISDRTLTIQCKKHPEYRATRWPKTECITCHLLHILRWQNSKKGPDRYQFVISEFHELADALVGLNVSEK